MNESSTSRGTVVFAGGGTGGHLYPSLAIAERLTESPDAPGVHFICSRKPLDAEILRQAKRSFTPVPAVGFRTNPLSWPMFLGRLLRSVHVARCTLAVREARCLVAMGGYVCAPAVAAAKRLNLPVILVNLDAVAGRANRRAAKRADEVFSVYESPGLGVPSRTVGYPVRRAALATLEPAEARRRLGLKPEMTTLLVVGGSLSARTINEAMIELARREMLQTWQVLHLAGAAHVADLEAAYNQHRVASRVLGFLDEIGLAWAAADVAISRAGAGSVAEVVANAVPTIFLPYPFHRDEHQRHNVRLLVDDGAAAAVRDTKVASRTATALEPVLNELMSDSSRRAAMRRLLAGRRQPDGAQVLADAVRAALGGAVPGAGRD